MHFFVTDNDYKPLVGPPHDDLQAAAAEAVDLVQSRKVDRAIVIGMESVVFSRDVPSYIAVFVHAGPDLDQVR